MRPAPDRRRLQQTLERFLNDNPSTEAVELRRLLHDHFGAFRGIGVVGGLVRDVARGGRFAFKSDVDLVIDGDADEVDALASRIGARRNRFGGYGFREKAWSIDFWALSRTWAVTAGHVRATCLADVARCTFFDWDAVVYDYHKRTLHCDGGYVERIRRGTIDIALRDNPGETGNLLRAARRMVAWRLAAGPALRQFIDERLDEPTFVELKEKERRKHSEPIVARFESAAELRDRLLGTTRHDAQVIARQLSLHLDPA